MIGKVGRGLLRVMVVIVFLVGGSAVGLVLLMEEQPLVSELPEASPDVARQTRDLVRQVRALDKDTEADPMLTVSVEEITAVLHFGARLVPGLRPSVRNDGGVLRFRGSLPMPLPWGRRWLNVEAVVPSYDGRATFSEVRLGALPLPPAFATALGEGVANLVLGRGMGTRVREAVPRLAIAGDRVTAVVRTTPEMRSSFTQGVFGTLRGGEMPNAQLIQSHYLALRRAIDSGRLPDTGSFVPYLHYLLETTIERATPGREDHEFTAGVFAMAKVCGAKGFHLVVGRLVEGVTPEDEPDWSRTCKEVRFNGRIDSRRHFITAAAIKAASTMGVSFVIGEFKELVDSWRGPGAFDFTDIAANASGIRFADTMMRTRRSEWPGMIRRIDGERAVLPSFEGIPGRMEWAAFERRFERMDSPAYKEMVERIESRIDTLALHRDRAGRRP